MRFLYGFLSLAFYAVLCAACETPTSTCDPASSNLAATCQSTQCTGTLADCKNGAADGCETNTATDVNNCGGCGMKCSPPANGEAACVDGVCSVSACGTRHKDCNAAAADGCEIDTFRDANNCGACGNVCPGGANAAGVCNVGKCQLACQASFLDCNGDPADGCETNGASDTTNCGNCGNTCTAVGPTTIACAAGSCITTACTGSNRTCKSGPIDSCEINSASDVQNCGACGKQCAAVANGIPGCAASNCGISSCNTGYANCDALLANGCETPTTNNVNHCGMCGKVCTPLANAAASCAASACGLGACNPGYTDCDKNPANGCEIQTDRDVNNCGTCGKVCPAGQPCNGGVCINDPCVNYGGTLATLNANAKVCTKKLTWGSWDATMIPAPWKVCTLTQWAAYAPAVTPASLGLGTLWIDNSDCGAGSHREIFVGIPMNDANCYNGATCCHADSNLYEMVVCQP